MEDQYALKPALWQTSLVRLQNVKIKMTTFTPSICEELVCDKSLILISNFLKQLCFMLSFWSYLIYGVFFYLFSFLRQSVDLKVVWKGAEVEFKRPKFDSIDFDFTAKKTLPGINGTGPA